MKTKIDLATGHASARASSNVSLGVIRRDRIRIPPRNGHERAMIAENVGEGVMLIVPDIPPAKRFLYFLWAMLGEFFLALDRMSDRRRQRRDIPRRG